VGHQRTPSAERLTEAGVAEVSKLHAAEPERALFARGRAVAGAVAQQWGVAYQAAADRSPA
jgi:hypothetical protein